MFKKEVPHVCKKPPRVLKTFKNFRIITYQISTMGITEPIAYSDVYMLQAKKTNATEEPYWEDSIILEKLPYQGYGSVTEHNFLVEVLNNIVESEEQFNCGCKDNK